LAKRESIESKVVQYFNEAPINVAQTVFGIVKGIMKSRSEQSLSTGSAGLGSPAPKARKARAKKLKSASGSQTSFPGAGVEAGNAA
jgi:hypothetical protein